MRTETIAEVERVLEHLYGDFQPDVHGLFMGHEAAQSLGINVDDQPPGTVIYLSADGVKYIEVEDDAD